MTRQQAKALKVYELILNTYHGKLERIINTKLGLCCIIRELWIGNYTSGDEHKAFRNHLNRNKPNFKRHPQFYVSGGISYWWPLNWRGQAMRIEFVKYMIKLIKGDESKGKGKLHSGSGT